MDEIYIGEAGTEFLLDAEDDISDATLLNVEYKKPSGGIGSFTGHISGTDFVRYITLVDDLDETGIWIAWPYVETPSGKWRGKPDSFEVLPQVAAAV